MKALRLAVCLAGVVGLVVLVPIVHRSPQGTYGGVDTRLLVAEAVSAIALMLVATTSRSPVAAVLIAVVGALWLAPELTGAVGVPLPVQTLADAIAFMLAALLLVAFMLRGGPIRGDARLAVMVAVLGAAVAILARLLLVDPFDDVSCWRACEHNPLRIADPGIGAEVQLVGLLGLASGVLWAAAVTLPGLRRGVAKVPGNTADVAGWILLGSLVGSFFLRPGQTFSMNDDPLVVAVFVFVQATAVAWLVVLGWDSWQRWRLTARLAHLAEVLGHTSDPAVLTRSLRTAVRDPGLHLEYWAPSRQMYVDDAGRPTIGVEPTKAERITRIFRRDEPIAAVIHARRVPGVRLERALGPALRLALENAQLRAAALAELDELNRSRTRVVERGELEKRRLERNLHDGAQQRVVSLALLVRLVAQQSSSEDQSAVRRAQALTQMLVEELRRVARGIYPAVLADAGLAGAAVDLAECSDDLPVLIGEFPQSRFPGTIETTAFLVIRGGIADARSRGATAVTVTGTHRDGALRVSLQDDAEHAPGLATSELADQVGALGGTLVASGMPGRHRVEVVMPCAS
jgi:signal transduction histidine kinase